ncbi:PH domain-containing protein [Carboxylicivirga sp. N1Y90]|uniref:PH domain-containing protein n=1 Tax=Carboxylicivirga fragile TaxID=3417571 RepID=UPI003D346CDA|nr:PH domain-containing protein [Marinilabiliaceae bacterium N1Y90]
MTNINDTIWKGTPFFKAYLLNSIRSFIYNLVFLAIIYLSFEFVSIQEDIEIIPWVLPVVLIITVGQSVFLFTMRMLEFKNIKYTITKDFLKIERGIFNVSTKLIKIEQIQFVETKKGFINKFFDVTTIKFYCGKDVKDSDGDVRKTFDEFESIISSSEVLKIFE